MSIMHKFIAAVLAAGLLMSSPVLAAEESTSASEVVEQKAEFGPENFVKGKKNTFFALSWVAGQNAELENLQQMYHDTYGESELYGTYSIIKANSALEEAKRLKAHMESVPEGRRCFCYHEYPYNYMKIYENRSTGFWYDGMQEVANHLDQILTIYKRMGGPDLDIICSDQERFSIPWYVSAESELSRKEIFDRLTNDPRYLTEVRPELEKLDFEFCYEEGKNELAYAYENMYIHGAAPSEDLRPGGKSENFLKLHAVMAGLDAAVLYESVYKVAQKHYPDILYSNYDNKIAPEETDGYPVYSPQGYVYAWTRSLKAGNLGADECYGWNYLASIGIDGVVPGYPWTEFHHNLYNAVRHDLLGFQRSSMYTQNNGVIPWIGNSSYRWNQRTPGMTKYWDEFVYHAMLSQSQPFFFLYLGGNTVADDHYLSETLYELDELVGFEERTPLFEEPVKVDQDYFLSGMAAGGRNVWRITPNLCYKDVTIENFLYDEEKMIFKIGNQFIDFPDESFIYVSDMELEHKERSMFGYWVISPEGTRPVEYRDTTIPHLGEPDILIDDADSHLTALNQKQSDSLALAAKKQKQK